MGYAIDESCWSLPEDDDDRCGEGGFLDQVSITHSDAATSFKENRSASKKKMKSHKKSLLEKIPVMILKRPSCEEAAERNLAQFFGPTREEGGVIFRDLDRNRRGKRILTGSSSKPKADDKRDEDWLMLTPASRHRRKYHETWAGPGYSNSPSPSSLPLPSFPSAASPGSPPKQRDAVLSSTKNTESGRIRLFVYKK